MRILNEEGTVKGGNDLVLSYLVKAYSALIEAELGLKSVK